MDIEHRNSVRELESSNRLVRRRDPVRKVAIRNVWDQSNDCFLLFSEAAQQKGEIESDRVQRRFIVGQIIDAARDKHDLRPKILGQLDLTGDSADIRATDGQVTECYWTESETPFPRTLRGETVANNGVGERPGTRHLAVYEHGNV